MKLDLNKLSDAVKQVAGIAAARDAACAERDALVADQEDSQAAIDTLTVSLLAAATSPAGAVGIVAVAAALAPDAPVAPVTPVVVEAPVVPVAPDAPVVVVDAPVAPVDAPVVPPAPVLGPDPAAAPALTGTFLDRFRK